MSFDGFSLRRCPHSAAQKNKTAGIALSVYSRSGNGFAPVATTFRASRASAARTPNAARECTKSRITESRPSAYRYILCNQRVVPRSTADRLWQPASIFPFCTLRRLHSGHSRARVSICVHPAVANGPSCSPSISPTRSFSSYRIDNSCSPSQKRFARSSVTIDASSPRCLA
jgi:hypothetical protein